ncbi:MAG: hypothetical protein AABY07_09390, partial [Nanoarchaeota archaeon]
GLLIYSFAPQLFDKDIRLSVPGEPGNCAGRFMQVFGLNICFVGDNTGTERVQLHLEKSLILEGPNEPYLQINSEAPNGVKISGFDYSAGGLPTEIPANLTINGHLNLLGDSPYITFRSPTVNNKKLSMSLTCSGLYKPCISLEDTAVSPGSKVLISSSGIIITDQKALSGKDYACFDNLGSLVKSDTPCQ